jgi:serine/threonine protein phosphatase 1
MGRTFAVGDIHGDKFALYRLLAELPELTSEDTMVFLGDYLDCGYHSRDVVAFLRGLAANTPAKVVVLRGNHEDAWLRVVDRGWPEYLSPPDNGCVATLRSFEGSTPSEELATEDEARRMARGTFFPLDVIHWLRSLPFFYEDEHAIYVHAGLTHTDGEFLHPSKVDNPVALLWCRDQKFFRDYRGKRVVFGHTVTLNLPEELSTYTPEDPTDLWAGPCCIGVDTGCGKGGFLTAVELPTGNVYESR